MGKSSSSTSSGSYGAYPQYQQAYSQLLSEAQGLGSRPLQQYPGQMVAGFSPQQQQAFGLAGNLPNAVTPYLNQASNYFSQATQPLWSGVQQFSPNAVNQYNSPYTQNVVNATAAQLGSQNRAQQQQLVGNAAASGAWGGDRSAVMQSELANQQNLAMGQTIGGLQQQGYQTSLGEFNTQQQAQLGANEANSWLNSQAAFGMGNLGMENLNSQTSAINTLLGTGGLQQQQQQEQLNVPYEQWLQQQAWPYQQMNWLSGIETGLGGAAGGTQTQTTPGPSGTSQALGTLGTLASIAALFMMNRGGKIPERAFGGRAVERAFGGPANDNGEPFDMRATGTAGLPRYDWGGIVDPVPVATGVENPDVSIFGTPHLTPAARPQSPMGATQAAASPGAFGAGSLGQLRGAFSGLFGSGDSPQALDIGSAAQYPDFSSALMSEVPIPTVSIGARDGGRIGRDHGGNVPEDPDLELSPSGDVQPIAAAPPPADQAAPAGGGAFGTSATVLPFRGSSYQPPKADYSRAEGIEKRAPWEALLAASLGMLGGTSPYAGVNIGRGGLEGLKTYEGLQSQAEQERAKQTEMAGTGAYRKASLDEEADKVDAQLQESKDRIALEGKHYDQLTDVEKQKLASQQEYQQGELGLRRQGLGIEAEKAAQGKFSLVPGMGVDATGNQVAGSYVFDTRTGQSVFKPGQMTGQAAAQEGLFGGMGTAGGSAAAATATTAPKVDPKSGLPLPVGTNEDALKNLSPGIANQVRMMVQGRMPPPSSFALSRPYWQQMLSIASQYDPSFDEVNWGARTKTRNDFVAGKSAQNLTSLNTVMGHLDALKQAGDSLDSGDLPAANAVVNWFRQQTGDPRVTDFETAKQAVQDELERTFRGSAGAVTGIKGWGEKLSANASPDQKQQAWKTLGTLIDSRMDALADQYGRGMGVDTEGLSLLSPKARQAYQNITGRPLSQVTIGATGKPMATPGAGGYQQAQPPAAPALPDAARAALQPGHVTTFANGQRWTIQNGAPVQVP